MRLYIRHSKSNSLRKEENNVIKKRHREERMQPKTGCLSIKVFLCYFFLELSFCSFASLWRALVTLQWATTKNIQKVICASEADILSHPKHYNSTILPKWLVNTCVSMCKSECTHKLKLLFLIISTSFDHGTTLVS